MMRWPDSPTMPKSMLQARLQNRLERSGLGGFATEHRFAPPRMWRFDLAYLGSMLAVEVEGGGWVNGRHVRGKGYAGDLVKYNEATARGWAIIRVDAAQIENGQAIDFIRRALEMRRNGKTQ